MSIRDSPNYKWKLVAVLFLVAAINYADRGALAVVFPLLRVDLGMSDLALAAIGSLFLWSYALCSPFAGLIGDRLSRSAVVTWSLAAWSMVTFLTGFVPSSRWLLGMRVLLGVTESLFIPASLALIADYHTSKSRAMAMGIHLSGFYVGTIAGSTVTGFIADRWGWRPSLFLLGGAGILLAFLCLLTIRDVKPAVAGRPAGVGAQPENRFSTSSTLLLLARTPSFLILLTEAALMSVGLWIFANWMPLYFTESFKMSLGGAGFSGTFPIQAGSVLGILAGGYLSDLVAKMIVARRMLLHGLCYLLSAPFLLAFIWSPGYGLIMASVFAFSLLRALGAANANPLLCDLLPARSRSTAIGLMNMTNTLAGGAGIMVAGYLKQTLGLGGVFAGTSAIVLGCGLLLLVGFRYFLGRDLHKQQSQMIPAQEGMAT